MAYKLEIETEGEARRGDGDLLQEITCITIYLWIILFIYFQQSSEICWIG